MTTPIYDFLKDYVNKNVVRLHMPGHKGNLNFELLNKISAFDITEIRGADSLYYANGIIKKSEENASELFESKSTLYSAGGSTLCIQAMISLVCHPFDKIIAARNAHTAFINTAVLLGLSVSWVMPKYNDSFGVSGEITCDAIENAIMQTPDAKAVYVTSPDYLGVMSDIKKISQVCKKYNMPLIVDNAHGAHLKFLKQDLHPILCGASLCCDSAHKTLPVLTGGAYLHIAKGFHTTYAEAKNAMTLFGSTSPSYLTLLSLDLCNNYLENNARKDFANLCAKIDKLHAVMLKKGFCPIAKDLDITKLTVSFKQTASTYKEALYLLDKYNLEPEYISNEHIVFMLSPQNSDSDLTSISMFISSLLPNNNKEVKSKNIFILPKSKLEPRQAYFAQKELIDVDNSVGRICSESKALCPPGVPVIIPGEIINEQTKNLLKTSSIFKINVVK